MEEVDASCQLAQNPEPLLEASILPLRDSASRKLLEASEVLFRFHQTRLFGQDLASAGERKLPRKFLLGEWVEEAQRAGAVVFIAGTVLQ